LTAWLPPLAERTPERIAVLPAHGLPNRLALDEHTGPCTAFVANSRDNTMSVIDAATRAVTATIGVGDDR
jgi:YVTN family beta-propeller protein